MSLKTKEISSEEWNDILSEDQKKSLFFQVNFHELISNAYNKTCSYYAVCNESEIIIALPIYHTGKDASLITHFFYQVIFFNTKLSERKKIEAFNFLASSLIENFDKIDFKLDPKIVDVRAFLWNGFESNTYYSYHINTNDILNYSDNIKRQLKKNYLTHRVELLSTWNEVIIELQLRDMVKNGLTKKESIKVKKWLKSCFEQNLLDVSVLKNSDENIVGSSIFLKSASSAYLIAVMSEQSSQAMLYDKAIEYYKQTGCSDIDLLGANIPNVAIYKSQFDSNLISYHIVSYRRNKVWEQIKKTIKSKIKSIYR